MKRIIFIVSLFLVLPFVSVNALENDITKIDESIVNLNKVTITPHEFDNLIKYGFDYDQIMFLDQETINRNKNIEGQLVSKTTSYIKLVEVFDKSDYNRLNTSSNVTPKKVYEIELSKEQYYNELNNKELQVIAADEARHNHTYSYRTLTTILWQVGSESSRQYKVSNVVQWNQTPSTRSFDLIAITFNNSNISVLSGSNYGFQTYTRVNRITLDYTFETINYSVNSDHYTKKPQGYALAMNLVDDTLFEKMQNFNSYLEYTVIKNNTSIIPNLQFKGTYVHSTSSVNLLDVVGFAIDPSKTGLAMLLLSDPIKRKYDDGNKTLVQLIGVNW